MNEILAWIEAGRHWHPGVALFNKLSNNFNMKSYFNKCEPTNANQDSLLYELKKLLTVKVDAPVASSPATTAPAAKVNADEEIERLDAEWKPKFKELAGLRQRLMFYGKDEERKKAAFRILNLFDECKAIWRKRDYLITNGSFPEIPEETKQLPDDPGKLILKRNNLRTRISKTLGRMRGYDEGKKTEKEKDIAGWRNEIIFIDEKLKQLGAI